MDIKLAFNLVRREAVLRRLRDTLAEAWSPHIEVFLVARDFEIWWDERTDDTGDTDWELAFSNRVGNAIRFSGRSNDPNSGFGSACSFK